MQHPCFPFHARPLDDSSHLSLPPHPFLSLPPPPLPPIHFLFFLFGFALVPRKLSFRSIGVFRFPPSFRCYTVPFYSCRTQQMLHRGREEEAARYSQGTILLSIRLKPGLARGGRNRISFRSTMPFSWNSISNVSLLPRNLKEDRTFRLRKMTRSWRINSPLSVSKASSFRSVSFPFESSFFFFFS